MGSFPFSALVGMERARHALTCLAVQPALKGVVVAAGPGTAKTRIARAFRELLPASTPFVEVPLGVTEDRLLGGLHLERTLLTGRRQIAEGLLTRAHGGILYVDGINLLGRSLSQIIAAGLNAGVVHVEREGISACLPADFALLGTYDPNDGEPDASLRDAIGICVREDRCLSAVDRVEILKRVAAFGRDPRAFAQQYQSDAALLKEQIAAARARLPEVEIKPVDRERLSLAAVHLGVQGHRADIFAVRFACASAALAGHTCVQEEDLKAAVEFVLLPRATAVSQPCARDGSQEPADSPEPHEYAPPSMEDMVVQARDCSVPDGLLDTPQPPAQSRGVRQAGSARKHGWDTTSWSRGRYVRAVLRRPGATKIALAATLSAAATRPRPPGEAVHVTAGDLRFKQYSRKSGMLIIFAVDASGSMAANRMCQAKGALLRLLQQAYLHRDTVALIGFRGDRAEILLPPTRSVELAKRALDCLPVGGGTPLAAGLDAARDLAHRARRAGVQNTLLVLLTDGRPNVALRHGQGIWQELEEVCRALRSEGVTAAVIDTNHRVTATAGVEKLATWLGGTHVRLPRSDAAAVFDAVANVAEIARTA